MAILRSSSASHAHFTNIPVGADLLVQDEALVPDLVVYPLGLGTVVAEGDDYGTQQSLLISPAMFRSVFKPRLAELVSYNFV